LRALLGAFGKEWITMSTRLNPNGDSAPLGMGLNWRPPTRGAVLFTSQVRGFAASIAEEASNFGIEAKLLEVASREAGEFFAPDGAARSMTNWVVWLVFGDGTSVGESELKWAIDRSMDVQRKGATVRALSWNRASTEHPEVTLETRARLAELAKSYLKERMLSLRDSPNNAELGLFRANWTASDFSGDVALRASLQRQLTELGCYRKAFSGRAEGRTSLRFALTFFELDTFGMIEVLAEDAESHGFNFDVADFSTSDGAASIKLGGFFDARVTPEEAESLASSFSMILGRCKPSLYEGPSPEFRSDSLRKRRRGLRIVQVQDTSMEAGRLARVARTLRDSSAEFSAMHIGSGLLSGCSSKPCDQKVRIHLDVGHLAVPERVRIYEDLKELYRVRDSKAIMRVTPSVNRLARQFAEEVDYLLRAGLMSKAQLKALRGRSRS
jgi:hypothetical protein